MSVIPFIERARKQPHPAKVNSQRVIAAARGTGISELEIRKLLAGGKLGQSIPNEAIESITKGIKFQRWSKLNRAIAQCERKLRMKSLPDDVWIAVNKAKAEYMTQLSQLTDQLDELSKKAASVGNGQGPAHAFGPREQIGNVTAVQVNIGEAQKPAPVTDVNRNSI